MLRLFPLKGDHPAAQDRSLQHVLDALAGRAPADALGELIGLIDAAKAAGSEDMAAALRRLEALDEAGQAPARALYDQYLAQHGQRGRMASWRRGRKFFARLCDGYQTLLSAAEAARRNEPATAETIARLLRASSAIQRWDAVRFGPFDPRHWQRIGRAFMAARALGLADRPVRIRCDRQTETTIEREYVRAVALATLALDELTELQIDQATHLVHYLLPALQLSAEPEAHSLFWIDPALGTAPTRMARPPKPSPTLLYFSSGDAIDALLEMESLLQHGTVPPALGISGDHALAAFGPLLRHLIQHWSHEPLVRRHRRHALPGTLHVVEGLVPLAEHLTGEAAAIPATWAQHDASLHGIGATAPMDDSGRLQVGTLVGLHSSDGNRWLAGVVRRLQRVEEENGRVGVELQSWHPVAARADDGAQQARVLLLDPLTRGATIRVAIPLGVLRSGAALFLIAQNRAVKLTPVALIERGADHEIRSYQVSTGAADEPA